MAVKILERCLCPSCERDMTAAHVVHKEVPYSQGSAVCDWCHKKRYCTRYKVQVGKEEKTPSTAEAVPLPQAPQAAGGGEEGGAV